MHGVSWLFRNSVPAFNVLCRPPSQESSEMEYIDKYRKLEAEELDMYGSDESTRGPGK